VFDPEGLHRAVLNVVTNALDACEQQPSARVVVATEYDAGPRLARVIISDNGPGIEPDELDKIFSLFVSHKGSRGTGLGLPVTQKIIKEHGGRVVVSSQRQQGSRFVLEIPAVPPAARPEESTGLGEQTQA
jgi:signal transduction histidine kinase